MAEQVETVISKQIQPQHSTEAPCSANVRARIGGYDWQITCRSHVDKDDLLNMAKAIKWWNEWLDKTGAPSSQAAADAINIEHPAVTAQTVTPAPAVPGATNPATQSAVQTIRAVKLQIEPRPDGKVNLNFFEAGHQYADIRATKTPAEAVALLRPIGAFELSHMVASEYAINAVIDWSPSTNKNKNGKPYKNIVTIALAQA
jgi:hypothetical protein